jgi:hypothetical protein
MAWLTSHQKIQEREGAGANMWHDCSNLAALLDIRLERRLGAVLMQWLYVGSLVMIATVTLFGLLMSWWLASWAGWGFWMGVPISVAGGLVLALCVRLTCEMTRLPFQPE